MHAHTDAMILKRVVIFFVLGVQVHVVDLYDHFGLTQEEEAGGVEFTREVEIAVDVLVSYKLCFLNIF